MGEMIKGRAQAAAATGARSGCAEARILVVDDEDLVRGFLQRTLERAGYEVKTAADGCEGFDALEGGGIDLVITDIFMPRSDGLETIQQVRRKYPNVKMIAISGGGFRNNRDYLPIAAKFGADRTLSKPLMPADLLAAVEGVLA